MALGPLVRSLADAMTPWLGLPYVLFGASMGALIAFEVGRLLSRTLSRPPAKLLVAAHRAPQLPDPRPDIHGLPDARFIQEVRRLHGTSDEVLAHPELRALLLPLLRADFTVCETYHHRTGEPLDCPIVVFSGQEDGEVSRRDLDAWRAQTRRTFTLRMLPGGHFFLHTARAALLAAVVEELSPLLRCRRELRSW